MRVLQVKAASLHHLPDVSQLQGRHRPMASTLEAEDALPSRPSWVRQPASPSASSFGASSPPRPPPCREAPRVVGMARHSPVLGSSWKQTPDDRQIAWKCDTLRFHLILPQTVCPSNRSPFTARVCNEPALGSRRCTASRGQGTPLSPALSQRSVLAGAQENHAGPPPLLQSWQRRAQEDREAAAPPSREVGEESRWARRRGWGLQCLLAAAVSGLLWLGGVLLHRRPAWRLPGAVR